MKTRVELVKAFEESAKAVFPPATIKAIEDCRKRRADAGRELKKVYDKLGELRDKIAGLESDLEKTLNADEAIRIEKAIAPLQNESTVLAGIAKKLTATKRDSLDQEERLFGVLRGPLAVACQQVLQPERAAIYLEIEKCFTAIEDLYDAWNQHVNERGLRGIERDIMRDLELSKLECEKVSPTLWKKMVRWIAGL